MHNNCILDIIFPIHLLYLENTARYSRVSHCSSPVSLFMCFCCIHCLHYACESVCVGASAVANEATILVNLCHFMLCTKDWSKVNFKRIYKSRLKVALKRMDIRQVETDVQTVI